MDPLLPRAAGCQMVALNFQQVNLLFSYHGSAVTQGCRLSDGGSQLPTGESLIFILWIRCYPGLLAVRWWPSTVNRLTSSSPIFSWICCCPRHADCQMVALSFPLVNLFFSYIPMDLMLPWVAGCHFVRRCLSVSNRLPGVWCTPPTLVWGKKHSLGGEGGGGSIVWKTPDTALYSIYLSTLCIEYKDANKRV
jgi:hypothetical protein